MKTISITDSAMRDALHEIDALPALTQKQRNCLRLLTEEMYAMIGELLGADRLDFDISSEGPTYRLRAAVNTQVSMRARDEFLSLSSDGRNAANRGVRGVLGAIIETFAFRDDPDVVNETWMYSVTPESQNYVRMWSLSHYMDAAPQEKKEKAWDGMEKSIIANFADDVEVGVRNGWLDMTVVKTFS